MRHALSLIKNIIGEWIWRALWLDWISHFNLFAVEKEQKEKDVLIKIYYLDWTLSSQACIQHFYRKFINDIQKGEVFQIFIYIDKYRFDQRHKARINNRKTVIFFFAQKTKSNLKIDFIFYLLSLSFYGLSKFRINLDKTPRRKNPGQKLLTSLAVYFETIYLCFSLNS